MTPLVASLLLAYEHAGDDKSIAKLASIVDLLPHDDDLAIQRNWCVEIIEKHSARVKSAENTGLSQSAS
jgi:hypothetical protein